ncbi:NACHT, LRR and PYD domains-containing protein 12 [Astyanax mexicanus]|uniref:NACHT, LRR and PYD domains-containing protein 12 n=1 Tax=Astyanax mexicanus TaxID=7994 RepID=UPI0020CAEC33|nr:NACHT, LRR and PYD domains-containing protein 12 [Astyanax mexicanus]
MEGDPQVLEDDPDQKDQISPVQTTTTQNPTAPSELVQTTTTQNPTAPSELVQNPTAQTGGNVIAPVLHGNVFNGPVHIHTGAESQHEGGAGGGQVMSESSAASSTTLTADKMQLKLKEEFKKKFANLYEGTSQEGDYAPLKDIFTELYVIKGCTGGVNAQHEMRKMEGFYPEPGETSVNFSEIFKVKEENKSGTKVLTLGIAGVGKTVSVHKFILDWAEERHNQDLDFILFLPFRELNLIKENSLRLSDLLQYFHPELYIEDVMEILKGKYTVALILDGLDESKIPLNFNQEKVLNAQAKISLNKLLTGIIKGELLPTAVIWITSRPAAANQIPRKYFLIITEIRGFNDSQKEEYFRKRIQNQDEASRIISHIKAARSLHILCHIPVFCRISVSVLQEMIKKDKEMENAPTTLTEMYIRFLIFHTRQKSEKYNPEQNVDGAVPSSKREKMEAESVLKLAKLAFLQLQKEQLIFYEEDLKECDIEVEEAVVHSGVCTQIFKKDEKFYSFVHLSFQEFLAAVFVFITSSDESNPLFQTWWEKIKWRYEHTLDNLLKTAVEKAMKSKNGHLDLFLRFLFGLTLESNQRLLKSLQPEIEINKEDLKGTIGYIKRKLKKKKSYEKTINLFHCLSEMKDTSLTGEIQNFLNSGTLSTQELSSTQWSALVFVLMMSEETLEKFELKKYRASEEGLRRLLPVVKNTRRALLDHCSLSKNACETLASVLISDSALIELDLSNNDLQDSGVELLSAGLKSSHCKLQILRLSGCMITEKGCSSLASALNSNPSHLKELDLTYNHPGESGEKLLSARLEDPHCSLETLRMEHGGEIRIKPGLRICALSDISCSCGIWLFLMFRERPRLLNFPLRARGAFSARAPSFSLQQSCQKSPANQTLQQQLTN